MGTEIRSALPLGVCRACSERAERRYASARSGRPVYAPSYAACAARRAALAGEARKCAL